MKNLLLLLFAIAFFQITLSCGGEEEVQEQPKKSVQDKAVENVIEYGVNEAIEEVGEQLQDSTSELNQALDTIGDVLDDKSEDIENALKKGLNQLK